MILWFCDKCYDTVYNAELFVTWFIAYMVDISFAQGTAPRAPDRGTECAQSRAHVTAIL